MSRTASGSTACDDCADLVPDADVVTVQGNRYCPDDAAVRLDEQTRPSGSWPVRS